MFWENIAASGIDPLVSKAAPYAGGVASWFVAALGGLGIVLVQFLLTVVIAAILYGSGEHAAAAARRFGHRLAGERGEQSVRLAGQAIRSVALGVVVTALGQSVLGGIGIALAGMPFAAVLYPPEIPYSRSASFNDTRKSVDSLRCPMISAQPSW